ncbi:DUF3597 family protein, partial [Bacteroidetes/Chlorobi group bacterium Naka2016]
MAQVLKNPSGGGNVPTPAIPQALKTETKTTPVSSGPITQVSSKVISSTPASPTTGKPITQPLNVQTSIVDYLKSIGQPSDFASRTQLASQVGIKDYRGTAEQNIQLLRTLQGGEIQPTTHPTTQPPIQ